PKKISTKGYKQRTNHFDHVIANLEWSDGTSATITVGRGHVHEVRALEAVNSKGVMRVDLMNNHLNIAFANIDQVETIQYQKRDHLLLEQKNFYRAIRGLGPVMVNFNDGLMAVRLVDAVLKSLNEATSVEL